MKFSCLQQDLLPVLQAVARSVGVRSTLPVLDNILLSLEGQKLKVAATNLEIGVIKYLKVEAEVPGEITVPAKTLVELISGLGQAKVILTSEGEVLTIESGKFKASVNGIAAAEFPAIPLAEGSGISFPKEAFLTSSQILFASAIDEGRPVLTGVLTEIKKGSLEVVATDGFRLAHKTAKIDNSTASFKALIPRRTFDEVVRLIAEDLIDSKDEKVQI
ncbi:MAG: DNA polymerase III subunit beta, partial [Candidatus Daviesbacteria bacterium]|nr:DNA polymerase III subunit beta [Candidatus Daviesbacteria bacterium]